MVNITNLVRTSTLDLKNVKTAIACRSRILEQASRGKGDIAKATKECPYGKDVKMVRSLTIRYQLLTDAERAEVVVRYKNGMTIAAIADIYGCHYTTVGRILRKSGIEIREPYLKTL